MTLYKIGEKIMEILELPIYLFFIGMAIHHRFIEENTIDAIWFIVLFISIFIAYQTLYLTKIVKGEIE